MDIKKLLEYGVQNNASDLHIVPGAQPLLRINGVLDSVKDWPLLTPEETRTMIYGLMSDTEQQNFEKEFVADLALRLPNIGNFRVSALHQLRGIGAVFRVIPERVPSFDELALPVILKKLLALSQGLILVTGATGSGKSTTLAAMIDYINTYKASNIITIEDPIEFTYQRKKSSFSQMQVGRDTTDFSSALRSSLRQDPDVILLGELRDLETMRLALTAAETGHLVFATLHASSAAIAINRFADVFPSEEKNRVRNLLAETLQAVICQTLVKKIAGGRVAAFEIMLATAPIRHFIRQDMPAHMESTMQTSGERGMCTMDQYLSTLVKQRQINQAIADEVIAQRGNFKEISESMKKAIKNK